MSTRQRPHQTPAYTPLQQAYDSEHQADQQVRQQAREMDVIERQQREESARIKQQQTQMQRAAATQVKAAKAQGVETVPDPQTGAETIRRNDAGQPIWQAGFLSGPATLTDDKGQVFTGVPYRDPSGAVHRIPLQGIQRTQDATGAFYEFDIAGPDGTKQRIRRPEETGKALFKIDPETGMRYAESPDPATGGFLRQELGPDPVAANQAALKKLQQQQAQAMEAKRFTADELRLKQSLLETETAPLKEQFSAAEKSLKELEKGARYEQRPDGIYQLQTIAGQEAASKLEDARQIADATAWMATHKSAREAFAKASAELEPRQKQLQEMQLQRDKIALAILQDTQRSKIMQARLEEAAKQGAQIWTPENQKRIQAALASPDFARIEAAAALADQGSPMSADVERAGLPVVPDLTGIFPAPEAQAQIPLRPQAQTPGAPRRNDASVIDAVQESAPPMLRLPDLGEDAAKVMQAVGISDPAAWSIAPDENGNTQLVHTETGEVTAYLDSQNNRVLITPAALFGTEAGRALAESAENAAPLYILGGNPLNAQEKREYITSAVRSVMDGDTAAMTAVGADISGIRRQVREGRISIQEGRHLLKSLHGVEQTGLTQADIARSLDTHVNASQIEGALWKGKNATPETRAQVIDRFMDGYAARAQGNLFYDGAALEQARGNLKQQFAAKSTAAKVGDWFTDTVAMLTGSITGLASSVAMSVPELLAETVTLGGWEGSERFNLFKENTVEWFKRAGGFARRVWSTDSLLNSKMNELSQWAATAAPGDDPPASLAEATAQAMFATYHRLETDADAKARMTSPDTFNVLKDPILARHFTAYLETRNPAEMEAIRSLMTQDSVSRALSDRSMDYITRPRAAGAADVQERAEAAGLSLNNQQAERLLAASKVKPKDQQHADSILAQMSGMLGVSKDDAALALQLFTGESSRDPSSFVGYFRGALQAPAQEILAEAASTYLGLKFGQLAAKGFVNAATGATVATTRRAAIGSFFAARAAALTDDFAKAGMFTARLGQPLTRAQRFSNAVVSGGKGILGDSASEFVEEGVMALGEPGSTLKDVAEQGIHGAMAAPIMVGGMSVLALPFEARKRSRVNRDWQQTQQAWLEKINAHISKVPGSQPFTPEEFEQAIALYGGGQAVAIGGRIQGALDELSAADAEALSPVPVADSRVGEAASSQDSGASPNAGATTAQGVVDKAQGAEAAPPAVSAPAPLTPRQIAARQQLAEAVAEGQTREMLAVSAALEMRELPQEQRDLFTAVAKASQGITEYTQAEARALTRLEGGNRVRFTQAPTPRPTTLRSLDALPAVTDLAGGRVRIDPQTVPILPDSLIAQIARHAPSLHEMIATSGSREMAAQQLAADQQAEASQQPAAGQTPRDLVAAVLAKSPKLQAIVTEGTIGGSGMAEQGGRIIMDYAALEQDLAKVDPALWAERVQSMLDEEISHFADTKAAQALFNERLDQLSPAANQYLAQLDQGQAQAPSTEILAEISRTMPELAAYDAAPSQYGGTFQASTFQKWQRVHYSNIWRNDLTEEQRQMVLEAYGAALNSQPDHMKAMEAIRMADQLFRKGTITESILRHLEAALKVLKEMVSKPSEAIRRQIEAMQAVLAEYGYEVADTLQGRKKASEQEVAAQIIGPDVIGQTNSTRQTPDGSGNIAVAETLLDVSQLVTSDDPRFPKGAIQPRDRSLQASKEDRAKMVANLQNNPDQWRRYVEGTTTDTGRPIVAPLFENGQQATTADGLPLFYVISGNGRTMALREARSDLYKRGISSAFPEAAQLDVPVAAAAWQPRSVQEAEAIAAASNIKASGGTTMSAAEQAGIAAKAILNQNLLEKWQPDEEGSTLAESNRNFMFALSNALGGIGWDQTNNRPNAEGARLARNAMLALLLGDSAESKAVLRLAVDSADLLGITRQLDGIAAEAGNLLKLATEKPQYDLVAELSEAIRAMIDQKQGGSPAQADFWRAGPGADSAALASSLVQARSAKAVREMLQAYRAAADAVDTSTPDMFGAQPPTKSELIALALDARPMPQILADFAEEVGGENHPTAQKFKAGLNALKVMPPAQRRIFAQALNLEAERHKAGVLTALEYQRPLNGSLDPLSAAVQRWLDSFTVTEAPAYWQRLMSAAPKGENAAQVLRAEITSSQPEMLRAAEAPDFQGTYRKQKSALTRALNEENWEQVIQLAKEFEDYYNNSSVPLPDDWALWERSREDAISKLRREKDLSQEVKSVKAIAGTGIYAPARKRFVKDYRVTFKDGKVARVTSTSRDEAAAEALGQIQEPEQDQSPAAAPQQADLFANVPIEGGRLFGRQEKVKAAALDRIKYLEAIAADKTKSAETRNGARAAARKLSRDVSAGQGLLFTPEEMSGEANSLLAKLDAWAAKAKEARKRKPKDTGTGDMFSASPLDAALLEAKEAGQSYPHERDGNFRSNWKINAPGRRVKLKDGTVRTVTAIEGKSLVLDNGTRTTAKEVMAELSLEELELEPHFIRRLTAFSKMLEGFNSKLRTIAKGLPEGYAITAPLKGAPRALEKAGEKLAKSRAKFAEGQITQEPSTESVINEMADILRGSILVDSQNQVMAANAAILETFAKSASLVETRPNGEQVWRAPGVEIILGDRFANPTPAGYSDVQMKIEVAPGMYAELQVHIPEMLAAKEGNGVKEMADVPEKYWPKNLAIPGFDPARPGHKMFEEARSLPEDAPRRTELEQEMAALYRAAIQAHEARIAAKASSLETLTTEGSSPVNSGTPGTSRAPFGPSTQNLPPSMTTGSPSSSRKNLADGLNSGTAFTPELTLDSPESQAEPAESWQAPTPEQARSWKGLPVREKGSGKALGKAMNVSVKMGGTFLAVTNPRGLRRLDSVEILAPNPDTAPNESPGLRQPDELPGRTPPPGNPESLQAAAEPGAPDAPDSPAPGSGRPGAGQRGGAGGGLSGRGDAGLGGADGRMAPVERPAGMADTGADSRESQPGQPDALRPGQDQRDAALPAGRGGDSRDVGGMGAGRQRPLVGSPERNFQITEDTTLAEGGTITRLRNNLAAIRLLRTLQKEKRNATADEKQSLAKYVGWGAISQVFDDAKAEAFANDEHITRRETAERYSRWGPAYNQPGGLVEQYRQEADAIEKWHEKWGGYHAELKELLTEQEYEAAKSSTLNAHYTAPEVIRSMWNMVQRMGFTGGTALEPAGGVGHYFGLMPDSIADQSQLYGVELDGISGGIFQKLYPEADIQVTGFQDAEIPDGSVDLAISNVPFGAYSVYDPQIEAQGGPTSNIHNYFFAKALQKVKPGGLIAFITSSHTLDSNMEQRKWLAQRADLVTAFRLPNDAFKGNAGTEVVTDIIFLRKKDSSNFQGKPWTGLADAPAADGKTARINEFYAANPSHILGTLAMDGSMYGGREEMTVHSTSSIESALAKAENKVPKFITGQDAAEMAEARKTTAIGAQTRGKKKGALVKLEDGSITRAGGGDAIAAKERAIAQDFIQLRDTLNDLYKLEVSPEATDAEVDAARAALNRDYDAFRSRHGYVHRHNALLGSDPDFYRALGLEIETKPATLGGSIKAALARAKIYRKADVFTKRVLSPKVEPTTAASLKDAVGISLGWRGRLDVPFIASLIQSTPAQVEVDLLGAGLVFRNPETSLLETPETYLSGNVRKKLQVARLAAEKNPAMAGNVTALEAAQPKDLEWSQVSWRLGSEWIPADLYQDFARSIFGNKNVDIVYHVGNAAMGSHFEVRLDQGRAAYMSPAMRQTYATGRRTAVQLLESALNGQPPVIYDRDSDTGKTTYNEKATEEARQVFSKLREDFKAWVNGSAEAQAMLVQKYNEQFNSHVTAQYDGQHLEMPWIAKGFELYPDKKNAVWRAIQEGNTLFAHGVGGGKTIIGTAVALELKRLGLAKKPLIVVHNATLEQFAATIRQMAPTARVLVASKKELEGPKRLEFMGRIASGDWDAVVMAHSTFNQIPDDPAYERKLVNELIDQLDEAIKAEGGDPSGDFRRSKDPTVKQLQKQKENMKVKLKELLDRKKDNTLFFQELGIDTLILDEAHLYKKLPFITRMTRIAGIDNGSSQRGAALLTRTRYIQEINNGRGIFTMTGTPVTNTLGEAWNMVRMVRPGLLDEFGVKSFDSFVSTFATVEDSNELRANGAYKRVARLSQIDNLPEWNRFFRAVADVRMGADMQVKGRPEIKGGKPELVAVERTPGVSRYVAKIKEVIDWFDNLEGKEKRQFSHIPLVTYNAAKLAAIDMRLINPALPDEAGSKVNIMLKKVLELHERTKSYNGTQVIFADSFRPLKSSELQLSAEDMEAQDQLGDKDDGKGFNLYDDIKRKLIAQGVPADQIASMSEIKNDSQREKLFERVNEGKVRIIIGSTQRLGTGVNMQRLMIAAHHLDVPWTPAELEQRDGRVYRQGNIHGEMGVPVEIYRYGMKDTLDAALWQKLETKERFIKQSLSGNLDSRSIEDDTGLVSLSEQKAILTGPLGLKKFELETKLREISREREAWQSRIYQARQSAAAYREQKARDSRRLPSARGRWMMVRDAWEELEARGPVLEIGGQTTKGHGPVNEKLKELWDDRSTYLASIANPETAPKGREPLGKIKVNGIPVLLEVNNIRPGTTIETPWVFDVAALLEDGFNLGSGSSPGWIMRRIYDGRNLIQNDLGTLESSVERADSFIEAAETEAARPFTRDEEYARLQTELAQVMTELERTPGTAPELLVSEFATRPRFKAPVGKEEILRAAEAPGGRALPDIPGWSAYQAKLKALRTKQDRAYLAAVERGDMETAQRMVDEAEKAAGYDSEMLFRGRQDAGNVVAFGEDGAHFTPDREYAESYAEGESGNVVSVRAKIKKPLRIDSALVESVSFDDFRNHLVNQGLPLSTPANLFRWSQNIKYNQTKTIGEAIDAIESDSTWEDFQEDPSSSFTDNLGHAIWPLGFDAIRTLEHGNRYLPVVILRNPSQIKSADPVTYDDAGNVIPLSQRFNPETPDIRRAAPAPQSDAVQTALASMPPIWRSVLQASMRGDSIPVIALREKLSETAIGNILRLARGRLNVMVKAQEGQLKPAVQMEDGQLKGSRGRPDLALGAVPNVAAVDQNRAGPEEVTHAEMQDLANRMLAEYPEDAERLVIAWMDSGTVSTDAPNLPRGLRAIVAEANARQAAQMLLTAAAKLLTVKKATEGGDMVQMARFIDSYRNAGTEQARALGMRRDPFMSPAERHAMFIAEAMLTPPESVRNEMRRNPGSRERLLKEWAAKAQQIKADLKAKGYDVDAAFKALAEEQAATPPQVRVELSRADSKTRSVVQAILAGKTPQEAAGMAGVLLAEARRLYTNFREAVNKAGVKAAEQARDEMLRAAAASDYASQVGLPDASIFDEPDKPAPRKRRSGNTDAAIRYGGPEIKGALDLNDPVQVSQVIREFALAKSTGLDMTLEFWRASILSGPTTHVVNVSSGVAFGLYEATVKKLGTGAIADISRMFGAQPDAASVSDIPAMLAAVMPSIKVAWSDALKAWNTETRIFEGIALAEHQQLAFGGGKYEQFAPALKGTLGKVMRSISFRAMLLADEFIKSFFGRLEVAAQARQIARKEGLQGDRFRERMQELMQPGSLAWVRALEHAKKITFQTEIGSGSRTIDEIDHLAKVAKDARSGRYGSLMKGLGTFVLPFIDTPTNIFKEGMTMTPLGTFLAIADGARSLNERRKGNKEQAEKLYNAARLLDDTVNQVIAWGLVLTLSELIRPGDDEDELPFITGTMPWKEFAQGERDLAYRAAPPQSIRIGGQWYSYARLDPFASMLANTVDAVKAFTSGKSWDAAVGQTGGQIIANLQDKTFLSGISDLMAVVNQPERKALDYATRIATGFIPNLIRQPIRSADEMIRDTKPAPDSGVMETLEKKIGYSIAPQAAPPKVDVWGRPVAKNTGSPAPATDFILRLFSPAQTVDAEGVDPLDIALMRYNLTAEERGEKPFSVTPPNRTISRGGVKVTLTDEQYQQMLKQAGKTARQLIGERFNGRDLSAQDVDWMREVLSRTHSAYRDLWWARAPAKE